MQSTPRRDPKKFAQRTMAAAIAASALTSFGLVAQAQTTGGGIGAAVDGNAGAAGAAGGAGVVPPQGTTGSAGGTAPSGVAVPGAPANPLRPGAGPGINNTGSPVLPTPPNLRTRTGQPPIGAATGRQQGRNGTSRIPGNTIPRTTNRVPGATNGVNGANVPQPITPPADGGPAVDPGIPGLPNVGPNTGTTRNGAGVRGSAGVANRRPGGNMRTGTITNFTDSSVTFREGASSSTLNISPDTVVQMDGRNVSLNDIPANSQVRIERSPSNPNEVQRIVVVPRGATGTSVHTQTGTGSTGSANRSLPNNDINAPTANRSLPNNDLNAGTGNVTTPNNDINAGTANASTPSNDINAGTANASTPGNDVNSPVVNDPNTSNRPLAPGQNPADQPVAPFTRGNEQRLQAGFDEPGNQSRTPQNPQNQGAASPNRQFRDPATAERSTAPERSDVTRGSARNGQVTLPDNGVTPVGGDPRQVSGEPAPRDDYLNQALGSRLGMEINTNQRGLTVGNVTDRSLAARSGLMENDRIQSLNGEPVSSVTDFGRTLQSAVQSNQGPVTARVIREGTPRDISLSLPSNFFDGLTIPQAATGAATVGVTPGGAVGVNAGGAIIPANSDPNIQTAQDGTRAAAGAVNIQNNAGEQAIVQQGRTPAGRMPLDPPVGTQRSPITTEALKVPDVDLGWNLKATPEGVVMSSLVNDGLAARNKLEPGDIIESIGGRPVTSPGAVSYELHRHRGGTTVDFGILRDGRRMTEAVTLPDDHQPLLLNRNETFGQANNDAKEQGASGANPLPIKPSEESLRTLEEENQALRQELEELRKKNK